MRLGDLDALKKAIDTIKQTGYDINNEPVEFVELPDLIKAIDNAPTIMPKEFEPLAKAIIDVLPTIVDKVLPAIVEKINRPTAEWIPVSERLPKEEDYRPCYGFLDGCVMWQTDNGDIGFGWYYNSTKCWSDIYDHPIKTGEVIAWMPLPEPYKREGEEQR